MKIFLTGQPGVGKSTVCEKVKNGFTGNKFGVVAREIRDDSKSRIGFEAVNMGGQTKVFAHTTDITSKIVVGGKYFVDLGVIDGFVTDELRKGLMDKKALVFVDEIGRMQSFSKDFLDTVNLFLSSESNMLATIVFDPEPWSLEFKKHKEVVLINVSEVNRGLLPNLIFDF